VNDEQPSPRFSIRIAKSPEELRKDHEKYLANRTPEQKLQDAFLEWAAGRTPEYVREHGEAVIRRLMEAQRVEARNQFIQRVGSCAGYAIGPILFIALGLLIGWLLFR